MTSTSPIQKGRTHGFSIAVVLSRVMPPADVSQQQLAFEGALDPLSADGESELVQVVTESGVKKWFYYTHNSDTFMVHLNELLSGHPRYPIEVEFHDDPQWRLWADTVDALKARGV